MVSLQFGVQLGELIQPRPAQKNLPKSGQPPPVDLGRITYRFTPLLVGVERFLRYVTSTTFVFGKTVVGCGQAFAKISGGMFTIAFLHRDETDDRCHLFRKSTISRLAKVPSSQLRLQTLTGPPQTQPHGF
jgi:hypothetical protein